MPEVKVDRPRPAGLKVTPGMFRLDLPVSSNTSLSWSPFNRLMPLNEESCAVVVICLRIWLYCDTRLARISCELASDTGAAAVRPLKAAPDAAAAPPIVPIVDDAALLEVVIGRLPLELMLACRSLPASAVFSWFDGRN